MIYLMAVILHCSPLTTMSEDREKFHNVLDELGIEVTTIEHPEVFTVDAMMPYLEKCNGLITKNLFLKGKKKKDLWLVSVGHDKHINLSQLGKDLSVSGGLRFADESVLEEKLGVKQGCVTPLAILNDKNNEVNLVLDKDILSLQSNDLVYCHPMVNSATVGMSPKDLLKFVQHTGHNVHYVELSTQGN